VAVLASPFKSKIQFEAENATLRHQLVVLRRKLKGRARLTNNDRWFLAQLYRWFPSILPVLMIIRPESWLASSRLSPLLALEIASTGRATADRGGIARADPADAQGEFAFGGAAHPRRTAQARVIPFQLAWSIGHGSSLSSVVLDRKRPVTL
jgi:hypothetical protein